MGNNKARISPITKSDNGSDHMSRLSHELGQSLAIKNLISKRISIQMKKLQKIHAIELKKIKK